MNNVNSPENSEEQHSIYQLKLDYSQELLYAAAPHNSPLVHNTYVIAATRYGEDIARVIGTVTQRNGVSAKDTIEIVRAATPHELEQQKQNIQKESSALKLFSEQIKIHELDMKPITCHYLFNNTKLLFFFSAEKRIDFRSLVKDLVGALKIRIELRQVGVRDESRISGGIGSCGRPFCCNVINDKMKPVSIKMAKTQNLSLNSSKISGQCGRLLCCLAYEYDWYHDATKRLPKEGSRINHKGSVFKVTSVNILTEKVSLLSPDGQVISLSGTQLRKKNDEWQITADLDIVQEQPR